MGKGRLEAFSDGVIAIIITIMVLEMKPPHGADLESLKQVIPVFLSYALSFVFVGIYWNNHHHMLHASTKVTGGILWANLHLLFWLSLSPFATNWMGENRFARACSAIRIRAVDVRYCVLHSVAEADFERRERLPSCARYGETRQREGIHPNLFTGDSTLILQSMDCSVALCAGRDHVVHS